MNRCIVRLLFFICAATGAIDLFAPTLGHAQTITRYGIRAFPLDVERGKMKVLASNVIELSGLEERLAPGVRILSVYNQLIQTNRLVGEVVYPVNYRREASGLLKEIWLLTPAEAEQKIVKNPAQNRNLAAQKRRTKLRGSGRYEDLPSFEESTRNP